MKRVSVIDQRVEIRPEAGAVRSCFLIGAGCFLAGQTFVTPPGDLQANKLKALDFKNTAPDRMISNWAIQGTEGKRVIYPFMCEADSSNETRNRNPGAETVLERTNSSCVQRSIVVTTCHGELERYAFPCRRLTLLRIRAKVPCRSSYLRVFKLFSAVGARLSKWGPLPANQAFDILDEKNNVTLCQLAIIHCKRQQR